MQYKCMCCVAIENGAAKYRIIANIVFEGQDDPTNGAYKLYILHKASAK